MDYIAKIKEWAKGLAEAGISLIALGIVLEVLFKGQGIPFWPNISVIGNVQNIVAGFSFIIEKKTIATLQVFYYMPDYTNIIQEFVWQYNDRQPNFPRTHKFLNFWHDEIEAVIETVNLTFTDKDDRVRIAKGIFDIG